MHLGNARTALFSWAYARRHGGQMVLRIEDTDAERSTQASEDALLAELAWLGLDWDDGPHRQSERAPRHAEVVASLLETGRAYRCICTKEELETRKQATIAAGGKWTYDGLCRDADHGEDAGEHTVRLRLPAEGALAWDDGVFGPSGQDAAEIGDRIIRRSDGGVLYHLAVVVDDLDMGITHVIRGADHHANTPFQLALYAALDAVPPQFAHVPLIVDAKGKKLSKRREDASVGHYRGEGFLPEAVLNWLVRMGWSHGDQEVFSREEVARLFDLDHVGRAAASADPDKLMHLGQHWIKSLPAETLYERMAPFLAAEAGREVPRSPALDQLLDLLRERSHTLVDMASRARFAVVDELVYDEKAAAKHLKKAADPLLAALHDRLAGQDDWGADSLEASFRAVCAEQGDVGLGKLAQPVRVAVTGSAASPGIFETLVVLGRERTMARLAEALHYVRHHAG